MVTTYQNKSICVGFGKIANIIAFFNLPLFSYFVLKFNFFRYYPFLCHAVQQVVIEKCRDEATKQRLNRKEFYVSILNLPNKHLVRELTADKIGSLLRISGQVVRTHPVHPELGTGTFVCDDCGVTIRNIVQQFKYTPVSFDES